jgi:hypothetical protein
MATLNQTRNKAIAKQMTRIAGNVAHVALIDAGVISNQSPNRAEACAAVEDAERQIANLLGYKLESK